MIRQIHRSPARQAICITPAEESDSCPTEKRRTEKGGRGVSCCRCAACGENGGIGARQKVADMCWRTKYNRIRSGRMSYQQSRRASRSVGEDSCFLGQESTTSVSTAKYPLKRAANSRMRSKGSRWFSSSALPAHDVQPDSHRPGRGLWFIFSGYIIQALFRSLMSKINQATLVPKKIKIK